MKLHQPTHPEDRSQKDARDERGAIMVLGLFLALAVVAGIWCIVGIGNALLEHEISQEAADSAVYSNAVVHARGMNLIAFINVIMMAMTMLYLALSWLDFLLSTLILITGVWAPGPNHCILRYFSWLADIALHWCQYADRLQKVERIIYKGDRAVFNGMKKVGLPLFEIQVWAAQVVPHLGTSAALTTAREYERPLTLSVSFSSYPGGGAIHHLHTLFPMDKLPFLNREREDPEKPSVNLLQDRRIGLPVEGEGASQLCISAARLPAEMVLYALSKNTVTSGFAGILSREPISSLIGTLNQARGEVNKALFCQDKLAGAIPKDFKWGPNGKNLIDEVINTFGSALMRANNALLHEVFRFGMLGLSTNEKFYLAGDYFWKMNWPKPMARQGKASQNGFLAGPKKVVGYAYNGNDWMQVWAFTWAPRTDDKGASRMVSVPARVFGRQPAAAPEPESKYRLFMAQAEFYFDCSGVWQAGQCNKAGAAMYQMRWRARLRRVHGLNFLGIFLEHTISNFINNPKLGDYLSKLTHPFAAAGINTLKGLPPNLVFNESILRADGASDEILH